MFRVNGFLKQFANDAERQQNQARRNAGLVARQASKRYKLFLQKQLRAAGTWANNGKAVANGKTVQNGSGVLKIRSGKSVRRRNPLQYDLLCIVAEE